MRLLETILLALSVVFLVIGAHQIATRGLAQSYWLLMLAILLFYGYGFLKNKRAKKELKENGTLPQNSNKK